MFGKTYIATQNGRAVQIGTANEYGEILVAVIDMPATFYQHIFVNTLKAEYMVAARAAARAAGTRLSKPEQMSLCEA